LGLNDLGAISPGKRADLVIIDDLEKVKISEVYKDGELISKDYQELGFPNIDQNNEIYQNVIDTVNISEVKKEDFSLPLAKTYRIIELIENQIITRERELEREPGENPEDFLKRNELSRVAVIERHNATGNIGLGLISGLEIKSGAIASSVAHDSHNIIVAGRNRTDMLNAVRRLEEISGGQVVISDGEVLAELPLPIAGLMSDLSLDQVSKRLKNLDAAAKKIGIKLENPFMVLAFLALPVIPDIKITDQGLYDVKSSKHIDLTVN
ncbi:MAG: adenine deaminase C-terminal domain-containing protein, partial [Halarsenatibacteraceae bacterium]